MTEYLQAKRLTKDLYPDYMKLSRLDKDKLDKRLEETFYQIKYINSSKAHEKMPNTLATWGDATQAYK